MENKYFKFLENQYGFVMPNLPLDKIGNVELREGLHGLRLFVNNQCWMGVNFINYREVYQFFSHYTLAKGNVLCSGMGLLIRESWLLTKKVNITLVENNENIIQYHRTYNPELCSQMNITHGDIHHHRGKYDVVLLDHYELEKEKWIIEDVKRVIENIDCDVVWFWPLERICYNNGGWDFYCELRKEIPKLPDLNREVFNLFLKNYRVSDNLFMHAKQN